MTDYTWPSALCAQATSLTWLDASARFVSPLSGAVRSITRAGGRWALTMEWSAADSETAQQIEAFLWRLDGASHRAIVPDYGYVRQGTGQGTPVVDGDDQTGYTLATSGWTTEGVVLRTGDRFTIGYDMYVLAQDATASSGDADLVLTQPLRWSPADTEPLEIDRPYARFVLTARVTSSARPGVFKAIAVEFEEDPTPHSNITTLPDLEEGKSWYVLGYLGESPGYLIAQYSASTAWDIETAEYAFLSLDPTDQITPYWLSIKPDGSTLLFGGADFDPSPDIWKVVQYTLSTPGDISTATYSGLSFNTGRIGIDGCTSRDGLHMYTVEAGQAGLTLSQYTLSTAWQVNTASYVRELDLSSEDNCNDLVFKDDGTELYFIGGNTGPVPPLIVQYTLSTPWDISTATRTGEYEIPDPYPPQSPEVYLYAKGLEISSDGATLVVGLNNYEMRQYTFGTPWDVTTLAPTGSPQKFADITAVLPSGIQNICTT